ncbi:MAG: hypothetical protein LBT59_22605 [Clostridiales bacterium]|nr:hypothetical protein [Clostridiales bacterium]
MYSSTLKVYIPLISGKDNLTQGTVNIRPGSDVEIIITSGGGLTILSKMKYKVEYS